MKRPAFPALLRDVQFRRFWIGQSISLVGDQVSMLAVPLVGVLVLHANAAQMGYLTAVGLAPSLLFSLHAGVWLDRSGRRRQRMIAADVGRALLLVSIPVAHWLGGLGLAQLYGVAFVSGTLDVVFFVAYSTLFVSLTPPSGYLQGQALLNGSRAASGVAGQSAAGLLVAALTAPVALLVDAVSFLTSAVFLARISPTEPAAAAGDDGRLGVGVRFIARSPVVRRLLGSTAAVNYFNFVFFALFVLYAVRRLGVSPGVLGLLLGAGGVGAVIGSLVTTPIARRLGVGPAYVVSCLVFPASFLLVPLAPQHGAIRLVLLFLAEFVGGLGVMLLDITAGGIQAAVIPNELRARVSGAYRMVNYGVRPLGALTGGFLGSTIGLRETLWIAAVGGMSSVLWAAAPAIMRMKSLELPEPGPAPSSAPGPDVEGLGTPADQPVAVEQPGAR